MLHHLPKGGKIAMTLLSPAKQQEVLAFIALLQKDEWEFWRC